jgi:hypothetical protein
MGKFGVASNENLVECFEMQETGLPIGDPESGYHKQNPYAGRDPRFYHNILYNGATVYGNRVMWLYNSLEPGAVEPVEGWDMAYSGGVLQAGYTTTGTYGIKWLGNEWDVKAPGHMMVWPYIRLAEVYLNFAEAAGEAWSSPGTAQAGCSYSAVGALDKVRDRALMPPLDPKFHAQNAFIERVRNERRVELCFEDHRLYDIRRWQVATLPENRDIYAVEIVKLAPGYDEQVYPTGYRFEDKKVFMRRVFEDRHYLFAIKAEDVFIGSSFKQNPGWGEQY